MARNYSDGTELFRAVVVYDFMSARGRVTRKYFYGPYTKSSTAQSMITREVGALERDNLAASRQNRPLGYTNINAWIDRSPLVWSKV